MFISVYLGSYHSLSDETLKFIKQIGVDYVDLYQSVIPGYNENLPRGFQKFDFNRSKDDILKVIRRVRENGLEINSFFAPPIREALFGRKEGEKQVDDVCKFIRLMAENRIYLVDLGIQDVAAGPACVPGRYRKQHRGGYVMDAFNLKLFNEELEKKDLKAPWSIHFQEKLSFEDYFSNTVRILKEVQPVAEELDVRTMSHFDDPPIDDDRLLPGFRDHLKILELFEKVSSRNFGISFCCGTRYESGTDIFRQIEVFGRRKKLFHVHFRNVRGTVKTTGDYEEVALDDGDMDMLKVLEKLEEVGYNGAINPDHLPEFTGDVDHKAALAYSVAYIKGLMSVLNRTDY